MVEKRNSTRMIEPFVVSFKAKNTLLSFGSRIKDISETGACLSSHQYFPIDTLLEMEIRSYDSKISVKTLARIIRTANCNDSKFKFELGLVFLNPPLAKWDMLYNYIHPAPKKTIQNIDGLSRFK